MNTLNDEFKDAAHIYSDRLKAEKEAALAKKNKPGAAQGEAFKEHIEKLLAKQREESGIDDLLN